MLWYVDGWYWRKTDLSWSKFLKGTTNGDICSVGNANVLAVIMCSMSELATLSTP